MRNPNLFAVLLSLYTLGGIASLTYQVVLQRRLTQLIGIDIYSVTFIVFLYMLGIGLGALIARRWSRFDFQIQLLQIAILQVALGVSAYLAYHLVSVFGGLAASVALPTGIYYLVLSLPILVPTTIMGALTPLMVSTISGLSRYGVSVGLSYGLNVAGAALGALGSGLFLIGAFGLHFTLAMMAMVDVAVGVGVYLVVRLAVSAVPRLGEAAFGIAGFAGRRGGPLIAPAAAPGLSNARFRAMSIAFFSIGFAALGYEIYAFRLLGTVFGSSPYLFPILLFGYLLQLSFGTVAGGGISKLVDLKYSYPAICALFLVSTYLTVNIHDYLPQDSNFLVLLGSYTNHAHVTVSLVAAVVLTILALLPVFFLSMLMPVFLDRARTSMPEVDFGFAYFWQTLGNIAGVVVTGLVLFDYLSLPQVNSAMIALAIAGSVVIYAMLISTAPGARLALSGAVVAVSALAIVAGYPAGFYDRITYHLAGGVFAKPVKVYEDGQSLSLLYPKSANSTNEYALMANGKFYVTGILSKIEDGNGGILPSSFAGLAFSLNPEIREALFIGGAHFAEQLFAEHKGARITIIDINRHVFDATRDFGIPEARKQIEENEIHVIDGRRFMGRNDRKYDYIHVGIDKATTAGAGNVFSRDFFEVLRGHLNEGGVITFFPYPSVVKAALDVFDDVVVMGRKDAVAIAAAHVGGNSGEVLSSARAHAADTTTEERIGTRFTFRNLYPSFLYDTGDLTEILGGMEASTDDNLATEYILSRDVEVFPGAHGPQRAVDLRVWPEHATDLTELRKMPGSSGVNLLADRDGGPGVSNQVPFVLTRGGGTEENSKAEIRSDGSIRMDLVAAGYLEWPALDAISGTQWEVARGIAKESEKPLHILLRGELHGRGLVGIKVFCGETFAGYNFSYAEQMELPISVLDGETCDDVVIHVSLETLPGLGERVSFDLEDILLLEK